MKLPGQADEDGVEGEVWAGGVVAVQELRLGNYSSVLNMIYRPVT